MGMLDKDLIVLRVQELYQQAYRNGKFAKIKAMLTKRSRHLYKMTTVQHTCRTGPHQHIGTEMVSISQIRGTDGRVHDFDIDFYPLQIHNEDRWKGVAEALNMGKKLPPVKLIQVEDIYFVQDGHHRISVARALGQDHIEAMVTTLEVGERLPGMRRIPHSPCTDTCNQSTS